MCMCVFVVCVYYVCVIVCVIIRCILAQILAKFLIGSVSKSAIIFPRNINIIKFQSIVNQVVIFLQLVSGSWTIPFGTDRVVTPPPVAVTTDFSHGSGKSYLK